MTEHPKYDSQDKVVDNIYFNLNKDETLGTQKFFSISGRVIQALLKGTVMLIDEFDARLHPNLALAIIRIFNSKSNNPNNAQLIFATHNTSFLNKKILRRNQFIG